LQEYKSIVKNITRYNKNTEAEPKIQYSYKKEDSFTVKVKEIKGGKTKFHDYNKILFVVA